MTAITKAFTAIADSAVDPDSPVDTALVTALRDNTTHLREWLGASFYAGAAQDHAHDGVTSALVEIGANYLRNGSAESDEAGWTATDYSGGSHAISSSQYIHGIKSFSFTSTVLANGGGWRESNEYIPVGGSEYLSVGVWRWASVANVSSKAELVWYDNAKAQISTSSIFSDTNTPTSATVVQTGIQSPSNARYVRMRITGGVPGSGSATGTVYFDGMIIGRTYVVEPLIGPAAVTQSKLKTTTGEVSTTGSTPTALTPPGGEYAFRWQIRDSAGGGHATFLITDDGTTAAGSYWQWTNSTTYTNRIVMATTQFAGYYRERYVQSSPPYEPYRVGDAVPIFVFVLLDKTTQAVIATYAAEDPPWGNNGPTIINPRGRLMQLANSRVPQNASFAARMEAWADFDEWMEDPKNAPAIAAEMARKFTQAEKNADMPLIPHPFASFDPAKHAVVVLNPCDSRVCRAMRARHKYSGDSIAEALHGGHIIIDNSPMPGLATPASVMPVRARWKLT